MHTLRIALVSLTLVAASLAGLAPTATAATTDPTARAAAGWVARDLARNGNYVGPGFTIDAVLLFAATGTYGQVAPQAVNAVMAHADAYIGSPARLDNQAKVAFLLQVAGRDASEYLAPIRTKLATDGRLGTHEFGDAWAVLALARTSEGVPAAALDGLRSLQRPDGGFGTAGGGAASPDSTGMIVLALLAAGVPANDAAISNAVAWMRASQHDDGSFGNANATGLVAHAARQVGTAAALEVANAAARNVRELQVNCSSPLIPGEDPSVGGGFPVSWLGAIAYDGDAQDRAIESGIRTSGMVVNWRIATLQAALALPSVGNIARASLADIEPSTDMAAQCGSGSPPKPNVVAPGRPSGGSSRSLTVRADARPVAVGSRMLVRVTGLATRERYTMTLSGRIVARGRAAKDGTIRRRIRIPKTFSTGSRRVLRVTGSSSRQTGSTRVATAARRALRVSAPGSVRRGTTARLVIRGLLPRERYRVTLGGRLLKTGSASRTATTIVRVRITSPRGVRTLRVCGVTCARTKAVKVRVLR